MSDNDKMREAILQFGQDNPSLDLDFRLHTHGKYLTQEKAIVASRAFKAGAAWQAAQAEQSAELERLRKDAERWEAAVVVSQAALCIPESRSPRANAMIMAYQKAVNSGKDLLEAIDAAIAAEGEKE